MPGKLIVFEGADGVGKSTQVQRTYEYLIGHLGHRGVVLSKDLGGSLLGEELRRIMCEVAPPRYLAPGVIDLLFLAGHIQNWRTVVFPAICNRKIVVSDRWWLSQFAYSVAREHDADVQDLYAQKRGDWPDLTIFLHGHPETLMKRANARADVRMHQGQKTWNDVGKQRMVQDKYFALYSAKPGWTPVSVDDKDVEQVWGEVKAVVDEFLHSQGLRYAEDGR
jgi:dTMP kinase